MEFSSGRSFLFMNLTASLYYFDSRDSRIVFSLLFIRFIANMHCPYLPIKSWKCFLEAKHKKSSLLTSINTKFTFNVRLRNCNAGSLHPICGHRPSDLNKRRAHGPRILRQRVIDNNLLYFNIIGNKTITINSSLYISCSCMMSTSPGNHNYIKYSSFEIIICIITIIYLSVCNIHAQQIESISYY